MIIKLPNADFSANNIGTVDLRTEVNASTQTILDYYGKTWTLQQQFAIEDFLTAKSNWTFASKIKKLVIPILSQNQDLPRGTAEIKGFYDLISESILTFEFGAAISTTVANRFIGDNGFFDTETATGANNFFKVNFGTPTAYDDLHFGMYYHNTENSSNVDLASTIVGSGFAATTGQMQFGSATNRITAVLDPNSYTTKGLRIMSYDGTDVTGLSANLPFASTSGSGLPADATGDLDLRLLSRWNLVNDTTIALFSFGDALTQSEIAIYNNAINNLMDALWAV